MATTILMSTRRPPTPPTRSIERSWMARSSLAWAATDRSETSSRKSVPSCACSNLPRRPRTPVAVRSSIPNSSASSSVSTMAAQLTATKGPRRRRLSSWICRATSSFPEPDSPSIRIVKSFPATRSMRSLTRRMASLEPINGAAPSGARLPAAVALCPFARSSSRRMAASCVAASTSCEAQGSSVRGPSKHASSRARPSVHRGTSKQATCGGGGSSAMGSSRRSTVRACSAARSSSSRRSRAIRGSRTRDAPDVTAASSVPAPRRRSGARPSGPVVAVDPNTSSRPGIRPPSHVVSRVLTKEDASGRAAERFGIYAVLLL